MANVIDIGIQYKLLGLDALEKLNDSVVASNKKLNDRITNTEKGAANERRQHERNLAQQSREIALKDVKTIAEYRVQYEKTSTDKLVAIQKSYAEQQKDDQVKLQQLRSQGDAKQTRAYADEIAALKLIRSQMAEIIKERPEVQTQGAGVSISMLGLGRNFTNLFQTMGQMFGAPTQGLGGPALIQTEEAVAGGITHIGTAALGAVGGVAALGYATKEFIQGGVQTAQVLQQEQLAFESAGVAVGQMSSEKERAEKLAVTLSSRWNVESDEVRRLTAYVAQLGNVTGERASKIVTMGEAVEQLTQNFRGGSITAEQFAKILARDPDAETYVGRLTLAFPELAQRLKQAKDNTDELRIAEEFLTPKMKELDERSQSGEQSFKRMSIAIGEAKRSSELLVFQAIEPELKVMSSLAGVLIKYSDTIGPIIAVTGTLTVGTGALIVAKALLHSATGIEIKDSLKSEAAHLLHAQAVAADTTATTVAAGSTALTTTVTGAATTATYAWGAALGSLALYLVPVGIATAAVYAIIADHDGKIDRANQKFHDLNQKLAENLANEAKLVPGTKEYAKVLSDLGAGLTEVGNSTTGENKQAAIQIEKKKELRRSVEQLNPNLAFLNVLLEKNAGNSQKAAKSSEEYAKSVKDAADALETETKDAADNAIAVIAQIKGNLSLKNLTNESRVALTESLNAWESYSEKLGTIIGKMDRTHEQAANGYNKAYNKQNPQGSVDEHTDMYGSTELMNAQMRDQQKNYEDLLKDRATAQKETYEGIVHSDEIAAQNEINIAEETTDNVRELQKKTYEIKKFYLDKEEEEAFNTYGIDSQQYAELILKEGQLDHERFMQVAANRKEDEKNEQTRAEKIKAIRESVEDRSAALIKDSAKKALVEENLRYAREKKKIEDLLVDEKASDEEKKTFRDEEAVLEQEHISALQKIALDADAEKTASARSFLETGLKPISSELDNQIKLFLKSKDTGTIAFKILSSVVEGLSSKLLERGETSLVNAVFGDDTKTKIPHYADGTDFVPETGLAVVHKGEKITRAEDNLGLVNPTLTTPLHYDAPVGSDDPGFQAWLKKNPGGTWGRYQDEKFGLIKSNDVGVDPIDILSGAAVEGFLSKGALQGLKSAVLASHPALKIASHIAERGFAGFGKNEIKELVKKIGTEHAAEILATLYDYNSDSLFGGGSFAGNSSGASIAGTTSVRARRFHDTPGTLAQSGAPYDPTTGGYLVAGDSDDYLTKGKATGGGLNDPHTQKVAENTKALLTATGALGKNTGVLENGLTHNKNVHKAASGLSSLMGPLSAIMNVAAPGSGAIISAASSGLSLFGTGTEYLPSSGRALVGERGAEIAEFPMGTRIRSNMHLNDMSVNEPAFGVSAATGNRSSSFGTDRVEALLSELVKGQPNVRAIVPPNNVYEGNLQGTRSASVIAF